MPIGGMSALPLVDLSWAEPASLHSLGPTIVLQVFFCPWARVLTHRCLSCVTDAPIPTCRAFQCRWQQLIMRTRPAALDKWFCWKAERAFCPWILAPIGWCARQHRRPRSDNDMMSSELSNAIATWTKEGLQRVTPLWQHRLPQHNRLSNWMIARIARNWCLLRSPRSPIRPPPRLLAAVNIDNNHG